MVLVPGTVDIVELVAADVVTGAGDAGAATVKVSGDAPLQLSISVPGTQLTA